VQVENQTPLSADLNFTFERTGQELVVIAIKATYDFPVRQHDVRLSDQQRPLLAADILGPDPATNAPLFDNDFAPIKRKCDVLCQGSARAPDGRPSTSVVVGIRLGAWRKALQVTGARSWLKSAFGHRISDPQPFLTAPIGYDWAWGGVDPDPSTKGNAKTCEENPSGVGYYPFRKDFLDDAPLPMTSELNDAVRDVIGPHRPMAFGPIGRAWLPRRAYAGTYDDAWLNNRMPLLPYDFDDRYFQSAPPDQQIAFPVGGEQIELVNLTDEGRLHMSLPRETISVTFRRKAGPFSQRTAVLDTVQLLTDERKLCLTFRTRFACDRDIHDLSMIIIRRGETR
jgi:hypothetical protein